MLSKLLSFEGRPKRFGRPDGPSISLGLKITIVFFLDLQWRPHDLHVVLLG